MNDPHIRQLLFSRLDCNAREKIVLEEVPIRSGSVRADVVTASDLIECYEIKSKSDSLKRLVTQGWHYNQSFNRVTLVCASNHLSNALNIIPDWWGVIEVRNEGHLKQYRKAKINPEVNSLGLAELLNRHECVTLLSLKNITKGLQGLSNSKLCKYVSVSFEVDELKNLVLNILKERPSRLAV